MELLVIEFHQEKIVKIFKFLFGEREREREIMWYINMYVYFLEKHICILRGKKKKRRNKTTVNYVTVIDFFFFF